MFYKIKLIYNNSIGEDCAVADTQTVHNFITAYVKLHQLPVVDPQPITYYLVHMRPDSTAVRLEPHLTFGQLNLAAHGMVVELRAESASGNVHLPPTVPLTVAPPPSVQASSAVATPAAPVQAPHDATVRLGREQLNCEIAFNKGKRIPVSRTGLQINRDFVASHLPLVSSLLQSVITSDTPIEYVSRKCHCEIYYDSQVNRWLLRALHSVFIGERVYNRGQLFQIPIAQTIVRLGRKGITMTIYHTAE